MIKLNPILESSVFDKHQRRIAKQTLKMPDAMANVMGGPNKKQSKEILKTLGVKKPKKESTEVVEAKSSTKSAKNKKPTVPVAAYGKNFADRLHVMKLEAAELMQNVQQDGGPKVSIAKIENAMRKLEEARKAFLQLRGDS